MSTVPAENPATALHRCLALFRSQPRRSLNREAWAVVFQVHPSASNLLIVGLAGLFNRSEQARSLGSRVGPSELVLRWADPVSECLAHSAELSDKATLAQSYLDDTCMLSLETCAAAIGAVDTAEPTVDQVERALGLTEELLAALSQAELPFDVYSLMLRHVLALQQTIKLLPVVGMDGLYDAMIAAIGVLEDPVIRSQSGMPWHEKLRSALAGIARTLHLSNQILSESSKAIKALPPGLNPFDG